MEAGVKGSLLNDCSSVMLGAFSIDRQNSTADFCTLLSGANVYRYS